MKTLTKLAFAGAAALAAANAFAGLQPVSSGNGELTLFVAATNGTTVTTYGVGLGKTLDDLASAATIIANSPSSTPFTQLSSAGFDVTPAGLSAFLSANSSATITWGLMAGDNQGGVAIGNGLRVASSTAAGATPSGITNSKLNNMTGNTNTFLGTVSGQLGGVALDGSSNAALSGTAKWGDSATIPDPTSWFGNGFSNAVTGIGTAGDLYVLGAGGPGLTTLAEVFKIGGDLTLTNAGHLVLAAAGNAVPLPAAVWLFGSGLLGLFGIGRRRVAAAA
jgi:hypothetical protein